MNAISSFVASRLPSAHYRFASARAAKKREARNREIASRGRGQTQVVGHREDGSPIYRAIAAFRARPYVAPEKRTEKPAPSTAHGTAAALKAEAPQVPLCILRFRCGGGGEYARLIAREDKLIAQRAARKVRMAAKRRRGW